MKLSVKIILFTTTVIPFTIRTAENESITVSAEVVTQEQVIPTPPVVEQNTLPPAQAPAPITPDMHTPVTSEVVVNEDVISEAVINEVTPREVSVSETAVNETVTSKAVDVQPDATDLEPVTRETHTSRTPPDTKKNESSKPKLDAPTRPQSLTVDDAVQTQKQALDIIDAFKKEYINKNINWKKVAPGADQDMKKKVDEISDAINTFLSGYKQHKKELYTALTQLTTKLKEITSFSPLQQTS